MNVGISSGCGGLILLYALFLTNVVQAKNIVYAIPFEGIDTKRSYHVDILRKALSYSDETYVLQPAPEIISQSRALREISSQNGVIDVFWSMTSVEREQQLRPIRIPLSRGLLGWRLILVKTEAPFLLQSRARHNTVFVQGHDWPDSEILSANSITVHTTNEYKTMFTMIEKGRVDAFPRSVIEIDNELATLANNLAVAPDVMLYYPTAEYFFVAQDNIQLAAAIEFGLLQMYKDGSFDALFKQQYGEILNRLEQQQRKIVKLHNPLLTKETPLEKLEYWQPLPSHFELIKW